MLNPDRFSSGLVVVWVAMGGLLLPGCKKEGEPAAPAPAPEAARPAPVAAPTEAAAPKAPAAPSAAAPSEGARCSASALSPEPAAPQKPLPPAVESMRRRIAAAAVACDYEKLAELARENGEGFSVGFGAEKDPAASWSKREKEGEPVLAQLVKVLNLPFTQSGTRYIWPSAYSASPTPEDWKALEGLYSADEVAELKSNQEGYVGVRTAIAESGDWVLAVSGD